VPLGVSGEIEEPTEEANAVATAEAMRSGIRRDGAGDGAGVVVDGTKCVDNELADGSRVLSLGEEIGSDPVGPGDRKTVESNPTAVSEISAMKADVLAAGLLAGRKGELVDVGREVTETIERGRRAMRDHALLGSAFPYGDCRAELEPGRAELEVLGLTGTANSVHAVCDAFEGSGPELASEGRPGDAGGLDLLRGYEAPLLVGEREHRHPRR
jgi:hypothetical protein